MLVLEFDVLTPFNEKAVFRVDSYTILEADSI